MKSHSIVIPKKHRILVLSTCAAIVFALLIICNLCDHQVIAALSTSMWKIEPETPQNINDPPFRELPSPTKTVSVNEVIQSGTAIPLQFAYDNPKWKRQAYKSYWHSSIGRWSYVPNRIHYAMHRIFVTYPTASIYYDFIHDLGIAEESSQFQIPTKSPYENIVLAVMQTKVKKIVTLGNQVVVVGEPALEGLQVLLIPVKALKPYNAKEGILFQLVTDEGHEIDYTIETYVVDSSQ